MASQGHNAKASFLRSGWVRAGGVIGLMALAAGLVFGSQVITAHAATPAAGTPIRYNAKHASPVPAGAHMLGRHNANGQMTVELVLHPRNESGLTTLIQQINTPGSSVFHHWLTPAQFNSEFAPASFDTSWLTHAGLRQVAGPSPLVLVFQGTAQQFDAAFHTTINDYRSADGRTVYANATAPVVPASVAAHIAGVVGLDNVQDNAVRPELAKPARDKGKLGGAYGAGPGGNGLTPSQVQGIYNATPVYKYTTGHGVTGAVFELSGYTESDIRAYERAFNLPHTKIQNINVDGGACPAAASFGLQCDYGAIEDELDIQFMQAIAPGISKIQVYIGPNTDQGVIDTYFAIANQNTADVVSSSWGECEAGLDAGVAQGEFYSFAQMALQGQSISSAAGDNGSYDCLGTFGQPYPAVSLTDQVDDPSTDPLMTTVGGTSFFGTFDPGSNLHPKYPTGDEYVWNTLNNCSPQDFTADGTDISALLSSTGIPVLCPFGAGGGGNSTLWASPPWQTGPGVTSSASTYGASCGQPSGVQCREIPDVSLLADPNSGYVTYCTDTNGGGCNPSSPWLQIGGTSCASPIWAGIVALANSAGRHRNGLTTPLLYALNNGFGHRTALHDMVNGVSYQFDWSSFLGGPSDVVTITTNSNGVGSPAGFAETPNYDMATGVGTPNVAGMVPALAIASW